MRYILHIGMHKTGTKYFQHQIFPGLDSQGINYNPEKLTQLCCDLMKSDENDLGYVIDEIKDEKNRLEKIKGKKIVLISREVLFGDLFSFYKSFDQTVERIKRAFPEAEIITFLRYQVDWLVSCYRESIHEHHYQCFSRFIGITTGEAKFIQTNYKTLDLKKIVQILIENYKDNVHIFFFEEFKKNKEKVLTNLADILDIEKVPINRSSDIPNRGYSAFSIYLSILRYKLFKFIKLDKFFVHRPIYFFGPKSIPSGYKSLSILPTEKYWHDGFLKDNEEIRSDNYPNLSWREKLKFEFSWRSLIKKRIDKIYYCDWDILGKEKYAIESYYLYQNRALKDILPPELELPEVYLNGKEK